MDQGQFQHAQQLYQEGEYRQAAKQFLAAAGRGAEGNGAAYHMAGNALMRLRRYTDAISVYRHALRDETYPRRGAVQVNMGQALVALGEYPDAVAAFEQAAEEPDYTTPYKALQGEAGALLEMGKIAEAAAAYRKAAIDPVNPDPGKALNNLGLCFMALGRAEDAAEAYKAALGFESYSGRGKALANLGQAFVALERWHDAVRAFERATELHGYELSPAAAADYERARGHEPVQAPSVPVIEPGFEPAVEPAFTPAPLAAAPEELEMGHEKVDGWVTGEIVPQPLTQPTEEFVAVDESLSGWGTGELEAMSGVPEAFSQPYAGPSDTTGEIIAPDLDVRAKAAADLGIGDEQAVDAFFSRTDAEMKEAAKEERRAQRAEKRSSRSPVIAALGIGVVVLAIAAAIAGAWFLGFGWPTQTQTADGLMSAHQAGTAVESYWVAVPSTDVSKEMAKIPPTKEWAVDSVARGAQESAVIVTVTPQKGAALRYKLAMVREGVGWKVTGVDNDWSSVGQ